MESQHHRLVESFSKSVLASVTLGLMLAGASSILAQGDQPAAPAPTPVPAPTPIPDSQIPARTGEVAALLRGMEANAQPQEKAAAITDALPVAEKSIDSLEEEIVPLFESDGPAQVFTDAEVEITRVERRLTGWLDALNSRTVEFDGDLADLRSRREAWEITRNEADAVELPAALVQQVRETITAIRSTEKVIGDRRAELLTLQAEVAEQRSRSRALSERIDREIEIRQQGLLRLDSPPLWRALGESRGEGLSGQIIESIHRNLGVLRRFVSESKQQLVRNGVIFIVLLIGFIQLGRKARLWVSSDESLRTTAALLQRPVSSSMLVSIIVFGSFLQPTAPVAAMNLSGVVLLLILLRLLPFLVRSEMRPVIGMMVGLIALFLLADLIPSAFLLNRMAELLLAVLGAAASGWAWRKERFFDGKERDFWYQGAVWVSAIATVFFCVSAAANVIGAVAFGSLLAGATLASIYNAITLWVFVVVLFGAITVALRTTTARRLLVVRYHSDRIQTTVFRLIKLVTFVSWCGFALYHFGILDSTTTKLKEVFLFEVALGEFSVPVSSVGIFIAVIWVSIKLAQLISFVLDEDVLPRLDLPKGVPATISKTSTYLVVTLGCVIAVIAAGLDLSRLTIVIGALGVGIGFGLQNAVNNFVSGLILLFGRPINVGDKIQISDVSGVVKDIGIRATVIQSWQGAEVIVPNATLISDNLINWTLSDDRRRMEIPVGVAYGSPTARIIELLTEVARAHPGVLDDPEPKSIFTGFGDSALDFELRAWTRGDFVAIASDIRVGIDQTLAEHGIEIPFPQHDLHLRSVDKQAVARLAGDLEEASTEPAGDEMSKPVVDHETDIKHP